MRSKYLMALAVAGAFAVPASYGHDTNPTGEASPSVSSSSTISSAPDQVTSYYPDGTVVYQEGQVALVDSPVSEPMIISSIGESEMSSSSGSSLESEAAEASGDLLAHDGGMFSVGDTWIIAEAPAFFPVYD
jgi:hypothetical protein